MTTSVWNKVRLAQTPEAKPRHHRYIWGQARFARRTQQRESEPKQMVPEGNAKGDSLTAPRRFKEISEGN